MKYVGQLNNDKRKDLRNIISNELSLNLENSLYNGILPIRSKSLRSKRDKDKNACTGHSMFGRPLNLLESHAVMYDDLTLIVPIFVVDACNYLRCYMKTEGLFRKPGNTRRINYLLELLKTNRISELEDGKEVYCSDVSSLLKEFLKKLPAPLIPRKISNAMKNFISADNNEEAEKKILKCCLLIPQLNLDLIVYLMKFFSEVGECEPYNLMSVENISKVFTPTLFPMDPEVNSLSARTKNSCQILHEREMELKRSTKLLSFLIRKSSNIGIIDPNSLEKLKRRNSEGFMQRQSASVSRAVRYFVRSRSPSRNKEKDKKDPAVKKFFVNNEQTVPTHTPVIGKKHQLATPSSHSMSDKRKRLIMRELGSFLPTYPKAPYRDHIPDRKWGDVVKGTPMPELDSSHESHLPAPEDKLLASQNPHPIKRQNKTKRWSLSGRKKKKRAHPSPTKPQGINNIHVSGTVIQIASAGTLFTPPCASQAEASEDSCVSENSLNSNPTYDHSSDLAPMNMASSVESVSSAFQITIARCGEVEEEGVRRQTERLIRRSLEKRIARSPSARRIQSLRRRSRDMNKSLSTPTMEQGNLPHTRLRKRKTFSGGEKLPPPEHSIKRGRPNTVRSGLKCPAQGKPLGTETQVQEILLTNLKTPVKDRSQPNQPTPDVWVPGEIAQFKLIDDNPVRRESIQRIRETNAGKVKKVIQRYNSICSKRANNGCDSTLFANDQLSDLTVMRSPLKELNTDRVKTLSSQRSQLTLPNNKTATVTRSLTIH